MQLWVACLATDTGPTSDADERALVMQQMRRRMDQQWGDERADEMWSMMRGAWMSSGLMDSKG